MLDKDNRVKQFYKKVITENNQVIAEPYYFGTDGQLVDMFSGLDLEEELKIGGIPFSTQIEDNSNFFKVTEQYTDKNGTVIYTVVTEINNNKIDEWILENSDTIILNSNTIGLIQETSEPGSVEDEESHFIIISLYKGEETKEETLLHTKYIDLNTVQGGN